MARRHWTIVVVPPGVGESRSVGVSTLLVKIASGAALALILSAVGLGYLAVSKAVALQRLDRLERRNELLAEELSRSQQMMSTISQAIDTMVVRDREVRLLAGLVPVDPDVQLAGIGGPRGPWTEKEQILSEGATGRRVLELLDNLETYVRRANLLASSYDIAFDSLGTRVDRLLHYPSILPAQGWRTSGWNERRMHPIFHEELPHPGIDIAAPTGTPIIAAADGTVVNVFNNGGYGLMVVINHGQGLVTRYAHCSRAVAHIGQRVKRGDTIAEVGSSGIATAPHLHYEVLERGKPVNPSKYILPKAIID
jgi:murein DD-endopeptidase MepM/ murein hydrolase activator NlpD